MWAFLLPPVGVALRGAPLPIVLINILFTMLGKCVRAEMSAIKRAEDMGSRHCLDRHL